MYSKRGSGDAKTWSGGKLENTTSKRPDSDRDGSLGQKGLEAKRAHLFSPYKPEFIFPGF